MGDPSSDEVTFSQIDALARELFSRDDAGGIWEAADYPVQAHYRKVAARQLAMLANRAAGIRPTATS